MTGIRRVLILIGLTLAVTVGAAIPASATFGETVALPRTTVGTDTVAATAKPTVTTECWSVQDPTTLAWTGYFRATVTWTAVTTKNHSGYALMVKPRGDKVEMGRTGTGAVDGVVTYTSAVLPQDYLETFRPKLSIRTLTSHGWTADSPQSKQITC